MAGKHCESGDVLLLVLPQVARELGLEAQLTLPAGTWVVRSDRVGVHNLGEFLDLRMTAALRKVGVLRPPDGAQGEPGVGLEVQARELVEGEGGQPTALWIVRPIEGWTLAAAVVVGQLDGQDVRFSVEQHQPESARVGALVSSHP